jgi:hypothetical protein
MIPQSKSTGFRTKNTRRRSRFGRGRSTHAPQTAEPARRLPRAAVSFGFKEWLASTGGGWLPLVETSAIRSFPP